MPSHGFNFGHFSKQTRIGSDTLLAILSYSALALGVILISKTTLKLSILPVICLETF